MDFSLGSFNDTDEHADKIVNKEGKSSLASVCNKVHFLVLQSVTYRKL
ncbi:hypothetical protein VDIAB_100212 [Vibrio diabolicus]|nr:hypothetical protein VDIAB_100212 [Vibrio diabolicus]